MADWGTRLRIPGGSIWINVPSVYSEQSDKCARPDKRETGWVGRFRHRPRLPKEGTYVIAGLAGADPKGPYDTPADRFEFRPGDIDPAWKGLTDVEAVVLHFWVDTLTVGSFTN